jgi:hydrogenase nickel incorporation protein HypA/HybF
MHELSIADAVAQVATRHASGRRVTRVELKVGYLRQVVPSALEFAWQLVTDHTPLEGAELAIEEIPPRGRCRTCNAATTMESFPLQCRHCGGLDVELLAGEELLVDALELDDDPQPAHEQQLDDDPQLAHEQQLDDDPQPAHEQQPEDDPLMTGGMAYGS